MCETLPFPVDLSVNPCSGHLLMTPADEVVNHISHRHSYMHKNCMETDYYQQTGDVNIKIKTCNQFLRSTSQINLND